MVAIAATPIAVFIVAVEINYTFSNVASSSVIQVEMDGLFITTKSENGIGCVALLYFGQGQSDYANCVSPRHLGIFPLH